jgi:hypothetical protein
MGHYFQNRLGLLSKVRVAEKKANSGRDSLLDMSVKKDIIGPPLIIKVCEGLGGHKSKLQLL